MVRSYLSAVRHMHIAQGWGDPLCCALQLQLVLKGLRRAKPQTRDSCLPVTPLILHRIKKVLDEAPGKFNNTS